MNEHKTEDPVFQNQGLCENTHHTPGIIAALGELGPDTIIYEEALARLFNRHPASVKRAVQRGELPPPLKLFQGYAWTVRILIQHIESRLEQIAKETNAFKTKLAEHAL